MLRVSIILITLTTFSITATPNPSVIHIHVYNISIGTVVADIYGVARGATAIAVRVLDKDGSGSTK